MYAMGKPEIEAVRKVIQSGQLFRYRGGEGGWCDRFEADLARHVGVKHAITTSSGTAALICGLVGLGVEPGDEVIVPAYTFMASALAPLAAGAIPVLAEIDESLTLDAADVARKITRHTRAIMPVHMVGHPCDMNALARLARRHKLDIIEDACQAVGGRYRGRSLGSLGKVGAFSFNHFKIISCGEGGAVLTSDRRVHDRAMIHHDGGCSFRAHADRIGQPFFAGSNFRVSELQGAILFEQLRRLEGILARLRARRAAMAAVMGAGSRFRLGPLHDEAGDCGTTLTLVFENEREAVAFRDAKQRIVWMNRPIDTGRHVYTNWEPILARRGSHCDQLNPFRWARRRIEYAKDMCPRSLEIMARTLNVGVPFQPTLPQVRAMAKELLK